MGLRVRFYGLACAFFIASKVFAGQFYDDRPHISQAKPGHEQVATPANLNSILDFVLELRLLYAENSRFHLGRDGEAIYEVDWMIWRHVDQEKTVAPSLINISRKSGGSPLLLQYLKERNVPKAGMLADTGYEGSVVDAVNHVLEGAGLRKIPAHLISSVHPKSPSSRLSTQSYLENGLDPFALSRDRKEWYLDVVEGQIEDIEDAPHFTTTATEYKLNPRTKLLDAYCPEDADATEQQRSLALQSQIAGFMQPNGQAIARARLILNTLNPFFLHVKDGSVTQDEIRAAFDFTIQHKMHFLWADIREAYAKGTFKAPATSLQLIWTTIPIHLPLLFDLEPEQEEYVLRKEKKRLAEGGVTASFAETVPVQTQVQRSGELLLIEEIMAYHQKEKDPAMLEKRGAQLRAIRKQVEAGEISIGGEVHTVSAMIDEGVRGEVFGLEDDQILKVPFEADDVRYIAVEIRVAEYLQEHFEKYQIKVLPVEASGTGGIYLTRERLSLDVLGQNVAKGDLTPPQMAALEKLFLNTKRFAEDTGVGLDIKYDNLAWINGDWVLFDTGPRTSFGPYAFSLDIKDFKEFYALWKVDERRKNGITVEEFIARHRAGCAGDIAGQEPKKKKKK